MKMTALTDKLWAFWDAHTARDKALITWGGVLLAVVFGWLVLWLPASTGRAQLAENLPAMRRTLAKMIVQNREAHTLAGAAANIVPGGAELKDALTASLASHGLTAAQLQLAGQTVQVQMKNVSFSAWTSWLDDARQQFRVQVVEAHVSALKADGQVDLTASLQPSQPSPSTPSGAH